ncbi:NAD(P)/FAD-dependent oxidoreductase [Flindersiella endophytica]
MTSIDADRREIRLAGSTKPLRYDQLIYALGSQADAGSVPGVAEHAYTVASAEDAARLRTDLRRGSTVAVAGGGLTGLEAATELADTRPDLKVRLVTSGAFGGALSERGRRHLHRVFDRLRIEVRDHARIAKVGPDGLLLDNGDQLPADIVVWTTGFRVSELAGQAGLEVDDRGRLIVDETLRSVSHTEVYGIGDAAAVRKRDGQELRMACATGIPAAVHAVKAIHDRAAGRRPKPFDFRYFNQCISLGRRDALIQFVRADDSPVDHVLTGRLAVLYKELIVRGAAYTQRRPGLAAMTALT